VSESRVRRVRAANPSPMTLDGTNTYLIDARDGRAFVIDPGPALPEHIEAICAEAADFEWTIAAIAVTHGHPDHAPGAALLAEKTHAPVYAHPEASFPYDFALADWECITLGQTRLRAVYAPGHARDHLVFWLDDEATLFTGDVIIGSGTVVIAPPGGDMRVYQATLDRLRREFPNARRIDGGHGESIEDPQAKLDEYITHRRARELEVLEALEVLPSSEGGATIPAIVQRVYAEIPHELWPAAARQVLAYLVALEREGRVKSKRLDRAPAEEEAEILDPDLSRIVDPASRAVAAAELGIDRGVKRIDAYELLR
jgi:glyoxylase-like metal-dependent hydrolase (beta-lactamase superfamily II)